VYHEINGIISPYKKKENSRIYRKSFYQTLPPSNNIPINIRNHPKGIKIVTSSRKLIKVKEQKPNSFYTIIPNPKLSKQNMKIFQKALMNNNLLIASDGSSDETSAAAAVVRYDKFTKKIFTIGDKCPEIHDSMESLYPETIGEMMATKLITQIEQPILYKLKSYKTDQQSKYT